MKEILSHIESADDFRVNSFISILEMMLSDKPNAQGMLNVRRNRDVAQGTGALLSPNDWALGGQYTASTVLTMYKVTGKKGWGGQELWVPNIKLPSDTKGSKNRCHRLGWWLWCLYPERTHSQCKQCRRIYNGDFCIAKCLLGECPKPLKSAFSMQAAPPCGILLRMSIGTSYEKSGSFLA